jgi:hypothetical protein
MIFSVEARCLQKFLLLPFYPGLQSLVIEHKKQIVKGLREARVRRSETW